MLSSCVVSSDLNCGMGLQSHGWKCCSAISCSHSIAFLDVDALLSSAQETILVCVSLQEGTVIDVILFSNKN